jgi:arsenite oxidase small subunit
LSEGSEPEGAPDQKKRDFLKAAAIASAALALGGVSAIVGDTVFKTSQEETTSSVAFPRVRVVDEGTGQVANVKTLQTNSPLRFSYPLTVQPSLLVKLGEKVEDGVGPDGDIVAFSSICQHLGCILSFLPAGQSVYPEYWTAKGPSLYCQCHFAAYDLLDDGALIWPSQAPRPVPRVILEVDAKSGDVYATGMTLPLIYGFGQGSSTDLSLDLQGGPLA